MELRRFVDALCRFSVVRSGERLQAFQGPLEDHPPALAIAAHCHALGQADLRDRVLSAMRRAWELRDPSLLFFESILVEDLCMQGLRRFRQALYDDRMEAARREADWLLAYGDAALGRPLSSRILHWRVRDRKTMAFPPPPPALPPRERIRVAVRALEGVRVAPRILEECIRQEQGQEPAFELTGVERPWHAKVFADHPEIAGPLLFDALSDSRLTRCPESIDEAPVGVGDFARQALPGLYPDLVKLYRPRLSLRSQFPARGRPFRELLALPREQRALRLFFVEKYPDVAVRGLKAHWEQRGVSVDGSSRLKVEPEIPDRLLELAAKRSYVLEEVLDLLVRCGGKAHGRRLAELSRGLEVESYLERLWWAKAAEALGDSRPMRTLIRDRLAGRVKGVGVTVKGFGETFYVPVLQDRVGHLVSWAPSLSESIAPFLNSADDECRRLALALISGATAADEEIAVLAIRRPSWRGDPKFPSEVLKLLPQLFKALADDPKPLRSPELALYLVDDTVETNEEPIKTRAELGLLGLWLLVGD